MSERTSMGPRLPYSISNEGPSGTVDIEDDTEIVKDAAVAQRVGSLFEVMTSNPDRVVPLSSVSRAKRWYKLATDETSRNYVDLYQRAIRELGGKSKGVVVVEETSGVLLKDRWFYEFSVTREGNHVAIIPLELSHEYKGGRVFDQPSLLGKGSYGCVSRCDALFVTTTESALLFKRAAVAAKVGIGDAGQSGLLAGRVKSKKLREQDCVSAVAFSAATNENDMNVQELQKTSLLSSYGYLDVNSINLSERMGICRDICRGTKQLDNVGLKHFDQKVDNVMLTKDGKGRVIDIDADLYLPSIAGKTVDDLNREMPLQGLKDDLKEMGLITSQDVINGIVFTSEFHTEKLGEAQTLYVQLMQELLSATKWTDSLVQMYNETVTAVDDEIKRSTCITALGIILGVDVVGEGGQGKQPLPGFITLKLINNRFSLVPLYTTSLHSDITDRLIALKGNKPLSTEQEALVDLIVKTFFPNPGEDTPSLEELENAFGACAKEGDL